MGPDIRLDSFKHVMGHGREVKNLLKIQLILFWKKTNQHGVLLTMSSKIMYPTCVIALNENATKCQSSSLIDMSEKETP